MGTYGYAAPEYLATGIVGFILQKHWWIISSEFVKWLKKQNILTVGHLTAKSDVYSFGVVLLEMLSGKRAVDKNRPSGQHNLVEWAKPFMANKRKIFRVLDTRLQGQYSTDDAYKLATLALRCLSIESKFRPNMDQVVTTLEQLQLSNVNGGPRVRRRSADVNRGHQNPSSVNGSRVRRRSADDISRLETPNAYPRPSASPLYTWHCKHTHPSNLSSCNLFRVITSTISGTCVAISLLLSSTVHIVFHLIYSMLLVHQLIFHISYFV